ncbi:c-type cytochrome [Lysobacter silvisoli]|uniref:Cytochrome c n=1 Tax=Lysobacter silvisoli TaxID=2293254 RepID=A0A371K3R3_9GAMM|nr:cytochrome c [Lysobacter silvisoli]RDZ28500.1 cytochrome c [Lysobacter silvisoli]
MSKRTYLLIGGLGLAAVAAAGAYVWSGAYDVGADSPHTRPVYAMLETVRDRSIDARASELQVPADLDDPARIRQGAGNYDAMCAGCHLAPGVESSELSRGLYPAPPNLSRTPVEAARAFWAIKHGIKASGMPAWGHSMGDDYIWNMAALLQQLPKLDGAQYRQLVAESGGHAHGGGETPAAGGGHGRHEGKEMEAHEHSALMPSAEQEKAPSPAVHRHADGKQHEHEPKTEAKPKRAPPAEPAHGEHEHAH